MTANNAVDRLRWGGCWGSLVCALLYCLGVWVRAEKTNICHVMPSSKREGGHSQKIQTRGVTKNILFFRHKTKVSFYSKILLWN